MSLALPRSHFGFERRGVGVLRGFVPLLHLFQSLEVLVELSAPRVPLDIRFALGAERLELFMDVGQEFVGVPGADRPESALIGRPLVQFVGRNPIQELVYGAPEGKS